MHLNLAASGRSVQCWSRYWAIVHIQRLFKAKVKIGDERSGGGGLGRGALFPALLWVVPWVIYGLRGAERQHLIGSLPLLDGVEMTILNGCPIPLDCQGAAWGRDFHKKHVACYEALQPLEDVPA